MSNSPIDMMRQLNGSSTVPYEQPSGSSQVYYGRAEIDGLPFRSDGPPPLIPEDSVDDKTTKVNEFHCRTFQLATPEDVKEYTDVWNRIARGHAMQVVIHRCYDNIEGVTVYMEWFDAFIEAKK